MNSQDGHAAPTPPPGRSGRAGGVALDELAACRGVRPVIRLEDMAVPGLFDTDKDLADLHAQVRAWRDADTA